MEVVGAKSEYTFRLYNTGAFDIIHSSNSNFRVYNVFGTRYYTTAKIKNLLELLQNIHVSNIKVFVTNKDELVEGTYPILNYNKYDKVIDIDNKVCGVFEAIGSTPVIVTDDGKYVKSRNGLVKVKSIDKLYIDESGTLWSNFGKVIDTITIDESCVIYVTEDLFVISQFGRSVVFNGFLIQNGEVYCIDESGDGMAKCSFQKLLEFRKVLEDELQGCNENRRGHNFQ